MQENNEIVTNCEVEFKIESNNNEKTNIDLLKRFEINIKKNYIKTSQDFISAIEKMYNDKIENFKSLSSFTIVKNYINSDELSKIYKLEENLFSSLKYINLTANDLTYIPNDFLCLINLECLILNNNKIQKIENFNKLHNLERLELRSNRLKKLENIEGLHKLKLLTVSCNLIEKIDEINLPELFKLEEFCIFGNYLGCQNDDSENINLFEIFLKLLNLKFPLLQKIYVGGNYFSRIDNFKKIIIENLPKLKFIDGNHIIN